MNPDAKEFVPAYILKKRQEESERLGELTQQLGQVDIKSADTTDSDAREKSNQVQDNSSDPQNMDDSKAKTELRNHNPTSSDDQFEQQTARGPKENGQSLNNNNAHSRDDYQDSNEDDRYLLNAGEGFCEFNGEQFIIPGDDDDLQSPTRVGYDFGNDEDNEDEDIANAYEEFLDTLPNN